MDSVAYKVEQFRKDIRPAMRCFHPLRIYNKVTHEFEYHNCGKCAYCLSLKATELATRCFNECKQHKYAIFFTLTYDNENIPFIAPSPSGKYWYLVNRTVKSVDGLSVPIVHFDDMDIPENKVIETADGPVDIAAYAVVHLPDIQRFQKRLRINITRQFNHYDKENQKELYDLRQKEISIRIFVNPEYGPTTYRPHYHGIVWTDSQEVANALLDPYKGSKRESVRNCWHGLIYKSWQMCNPERCDAQFVTNSAPNYVAQYVAGSLDLPEVLRFKPFRPKPLGSKNPLIGSYKVNNEELADTFYNGVVEFARWDDEAKEFTPALLSYQTLSRFFARCQAYDLQDDYAQLRLFEKYDRMSYVRRPVVRHGFLNYRTLDVKSYDYNLMYLDCPDNDYFRYQNLRFYKCVKYWSSQDFTVPVRSRDGTVLCYDVVRLTPLQVIRKFRRIYDNMKLYQLRNFYLEQEVISQTKLFSGVKATLTYLLSYYPEFVSNLPALLMFNSQKIALDYKLKSFGLSLDDLYFGNCIKQDVIEFIKSDNPVSYNHIVSTLQKARDKSKSKKFKETYARSKGIIY